MITAALIIACVLLIIGLSALYRLSVLRLKEADEVIERRDARIYKLESAFAKMMGFQRGDFHWHKQSLLKLAEEIKLNGEPGHLVIHREQMPHLAQLIEYLANESLDRTY